ncbi:MAG: hypothetical protein IJA74_04230, partial [Oscillospiraceae bacterium]|nr:hypothetical protein [Oscillospiraceae bacterium]
RPPSSAKRDKKRLMKKRLRLRAFHTYNIHGAFERGMTKIKIFCNKFVNAPMFGSKIVVS